MKEILVKSYDILKEEQRNADNKAYIFIGLLTAVIGIFGQFPVNGIEENGLEVLMQLLLFLLLPLFLLIFSLIPRYNANLFLIQKEKNPASFNLYYWKTIVQFESEDELIKKIKEKYNNKFNADELDLISQIYANAKIMSTKATLQVLAFSILNHMIIFMFSAFIFLAFGLEELIWFFVIFVAFEIAYWVVPYYKNKDKKSKHSKPKKSI